MASSSSWIVSIKALFISTGVLAVALFLKVSVPLALDFSVSKAPLVWSSFMSWLKPPYLYLVINGIIITIAASSMFHRGSHDAEGDNQKDQIHGVTPSMTISTDPHPAFDYEIKDRTGFGVMESSTVGFEEKRVEAEVLEVVEEDRSGYGVMESVAVVYEATREETKVFESMEEKEKEKRVLTVADGSVVDNEDEFVISRSTWNPPKRMDFSEITSEYLSPAKPLVSSRFGHRKQVKSSPEGGRALRVAKPKRHETLENTWKAITEGRPMPLTRHLKKSDTWENHGRDVNVSLPDPSAVKKSETFKDRTNCQAPPLAPSPMKLRKEPSLSQDELNRRVEAFIKKFNEEMRLQRQESLNQYKEMISRRQ